ncbi:MAG: serine hydrolase [Proteobacteria bacterium]|nr:serine hydrolase [Pseudomonadota bacterium]
MRYPPSAKNLDIVVPVLLESLEPQKDKDIGHLLDLEAEHKDSDSVFRGVGAHVVGCSAAVTVFSGQESKSECHTQGKSNFLAEDEVAPETVFAVASCTKMITAATILRMTEHEDYKEQFPEGINTSLSHFVPALKEKYPDSTFVKMIEQHPHHEDITLRDLLQHTHGMGKYNNLKSDWGDLDEAKKYVDGQHTDSEYGKHTYSDTGPDLIALIVETVASKAPVNIASPDKSFADVARELVINHPKLKLENTLMPDDIEQAVSDGGKKMARGYCDEGTPAEDKDYQGALAAFGARSTPTDMNKLTRAFLTQDPDASLFDSPETLKQMQRMHELSESEKKPGFAHVAYGLGYEKFPNGLIGHDGQNRAFKARVEYDPTQDKCATVCYVEEHASLIMADSLSAGMSEEELLRSQEKILAQYTPEQLINDYERTRTDFIERPLKQQLDALDLEVKPGQLETLEKQGGLDVPVHENRHGSPDIPNPQKRSFDTPLQTRKINPDAVEIYGEAASSPTSKDGVPGLDKESMEELNEIKGGFQDFMEREPKEKSYTQKMADLNLKSPGGAREI